MSRVTALAVNTAGTGITATYNPATGVLTLSGNDSVANYQQVLRSLSFSSSSDDPTRGITTRTGRTLTIAVTDATRMAPVPQRPAPRAMSR